MNELRSDEKKTQDSLIGQIFDNSKTVAFLRNLLHDNPFFIKWVDRLESVVRSSLSYRWLTKDPMPEIVVINLKETYTIGPLIKLFNRFVATAYPYWRTSILRRSANRLTSLGKRVVEIQPEQLMAVLTPPEPSERNLDLSNNSAESIRSKDKKDD